MGGTLPSEDPRDVVRYWRLVELFSPQPVPALDPASPDRPVVTWTGTRKPPWAVLRPPTRPTLAWSHSVYLGVYRLESVYDYLHRAFPQDRDAYDERPGGLSACAAVLVDANGRLAPETAVLSSAAWGIGQIAAGRLVDRAWLGGFEDAQTRFVESVAECLAAARVSRGLAEDEPVVVDEPLRNDLIAAAWRAAGLVAGLTVATRVVHVASDQVRKDRAEDATVRDFLNSFYLADLGTVAEAPWGEALTTYLTSADQVPLADRLDVRTNPSAVTAAVGIEMLPQGRWPSDPAHPLATSQQFAVNLAVNDLGRAGSLLGVNGPPGTGKTTLLRDVFAENLVRRAAVLAELPPLRTRPSSVRCTSGSPTGTRGVSGSCAPT